ncbi:pupal cuticle protein G1A [Bicyclus anynana]|uniref:Pupal cuticle protein G1A n=1 Tax=Bicyclus anynana TaxID=110368 RepID=A0A6J1N1P7_BICAN|nr:pupal cuticle protein G1A [Bicyclus anynana]
MFKLVVLCAFLAAAVAEPGAFFAPLAYSTVLSPARTTITNQASSVIHPSPYYTAPWAYTTPLAHLIKKRSLAVSSYFAPSTYIAHAPIASTYAASPLAYTSYSPLATTYGAPIYSTAAHFIKKRSAPLIVPSTYVAPSFYHSTPLLTSTYSAPFYTTPYVSHSPIAYTHLIKKRSAPLALATYAAPAAFSHQSRLDIKTAPAVATYSYSSPITYASPFGFTHLY